ncbi:hypothetical protein BU15DRAFT_82830 [Melanogaster broomeanus]|nr:hypothetical protein BU15DRAFT_82830 [Melanogaster broomeanus]
MLFHISQISKIPLAAVEAIRAVAFLLEEEATFKIALAVTSYISEQASKEIASQVITAISPHIANLFQTAEMMAENIEGTKQIQQAISDAQELEKTPTMSFHIDRVEDAADAVLSSLEDIKNIITLLSPSLDATQTCINNLTLNTANTACTPHGQPGPAQPMTYSEAVGSPTKVAHNSPATTAIARAATREKQILIDSDPDQPFYLVFKSPVRFGLCAIFGKTGPGLVFENPQI